MELNCGPYEFVNPGRGRQLPIATNLCIPDNAYPASYRCYAEDAPARYEASLYPMLDVVADPKDRSVAWRVLDAADGAILMSGNRGEAVQWIDNWSAGCEEFVRDEVLGVEEEG